MKILTSETHPMRVSFLDVQPWDGKLGITFAPGKKNESYHFFRWERDLGMDLDRMKGEYGTEVVVTLLEEQEMEWMGIEELGQEVERRGMEWVWFEIEDLGVPPGERFEPFMEFAKGVIGMLVKGRVVVVHCRGGLGRSGLVAACLLALRGTEPGEAIKAVRRARGEGAVEMQEQVEFVEEVASVGLD